MDNSEKLKRPQPKVEINWNGVISTCEKIVDEIEEEDWEDEDNAQYIYEEVMKAVYGPNIFKWMDQKSL